MRVTGKDYSYEISKCIIELFLKVLRVEEPMKYIREPPNITYKII